MIENRKGEKEKREKEREREINVKSTQKPIEALAFHAPNPGLTMPTHNLINPSHPPHRSLAANPNRGPPAASSNTTNWLFRNTSPKIDCPIPLLLCSPPKQLPLSDAGA